MDSLEFQTMIVFIVFAVAAFAVDFFAHKKDEKISLKQAALWSIFWIAVSVAFGGYLYLAVSSEAVILFFSGYILEKSLSIDNLFVMAAIFSWFKIPEIYRHRVLYFGIIGAVIFRLVFVAVGTSLLGISPWMEFVFAIMVAYSAVMMMKKSDDSEGIEDYSNHLAYRAVYRFFPVFPRLLGHSFFVRNQEISAQISTQMEIGFGRRKVKCSSIFSFFLPNLNVNSIGESCGALCLTIKNIHEEDKRFLHEKAHASKYGYPKIES